jgi:putative hydrolase of the HAD superfamily
MGEDVDQERDGREGEGGPEDLPRHADTLASVLRAVLFDWGDTLMEFAYDPALVEAGHRAGLAALGRDDLPDFERTAAHFRERYEPLFWVPGTVEEIEYPGLVRQLLGDFGVEVSDEELDHFLEAEHAAWDPARRPAANTHALLEALRARGLKLGLVSNAFDPGWLLHRDLEQMGLAERLDFAVFSSEVGKRKPHPAIFERALEALGVAADEALFVGDRLYEDVRGAAEVGMQTVQALWFRADEHPEGGEPDFQAFTQMDVLNVVERLRELPRSA